MRMMLAVLLGVALSSIAQAEEGRRGAVVRGTDASHASRGPR